MSADYDSESWHHGVGIVVTDHERSRFFVQQKDADYPQFPLCYSFFGGRRESNESLRQALRRELCEELGESVASTLLANGVSEVFDGQIVAPTRSFRFTLFEAVVDDVVLDTLGHVEVQEGERGAVFEREALGSLPFIWSLEQVVAAVLRR